MQRRSYKRLPLNRRAKFYNDDSLYPGIVMDCSEKGMGIRTRSYYLPCSYDIEVHIPLDEVVSTIRGKIKWVSKINDFTYDMGVELIDPSEHYLKYMDMLTGAYEFMDASSFRQTIPKDLLLSDDED
jgi:hypothetical protein